MADGRNPQPDKLASTPLPSGWEAKYDYAQRRYFFIDHQTKQTTWSDPRLKQQHSGVAQVSAEHKSSRHSPKPASQHGKPHTVGWQTQVEDKYGMKVEIIKDDSNGIDAEATTRIVGRFPTVGKELIAMVSADCASEEDVCQKLRDMGYREDKQASLSTSGRTTGSGAHTGPPPAFGTKSPSHSEKLAATSGGASKPPGAGFPGLSLQSKTSDPLNGSPISKPHSKKSSPERSVTPKSMATNNTSDRRSASPARPSKGKGSGHKSHTAAGDKASAKASPLAELSADKKKRMQEKLEQEFRSQEKSVVESTLVSCSYDEDKARFELQLLNITKSTSDTTSTTTTTVASSSGYSGSDGYKMNFTAAGAAAMASSAAAMASSATDVLLFADAHESSPTVANGSNFSEHFGYSSSLRQETRGANASLAKGPNKGLLLSDYIVEVGSQSSYCHGPCKENYHGPSADLRKGHQPGIDKGPACLYGTSSD